MGNNNINYIYISLQDDEFNDINFNGLNFSLTLSIEFHYKRELKTFNNFLLHTQDNESNIYNSLEEKEEKEEKKT